MGIAGVQLCIVGNTHAPQYKVQAGYLVASAGMRLLPALNAIDMLRRRPTCRVHMLLHERLQALQQRLHPRRGTQPACLPACARHCCRRPATAAAAGSRCSTPARGCDTGWQLSICLCQGSCRSTGGLLPLRAGVCIFLKRVPS